MAEETIIEKSETSEPNKIEGKECTVGKFISEEDGWKILNIADTWIGTPYVMAGASSVKGIKGDCSGTTNKIYTEAGFPYPYQMTSSFIKYAETTNRFRELDLKKDKLQAGDILWWSGHMALYAPFPDGHSRQNTGVIKGGKPRMNDMYTAFNSRTNTPYGPYNIATFRGDAYRAFRYFIKPGEAGCE